eukprot:scaffold60903_cov22-Prasinocladus_malaysianus.AAC.2
MAFILDAWLTNSHDDLDISKLFKLCGSAQDSTSPFKQAIVQEVGSIGTPNAMYYAGLFDLPSVRQGRAKSSSNICWERTS